MQDENNALKLVQNIFELSDPKIDYEEAEHMMMMCAVEDLSEAESRNRYPQLWQFFEFDREMYNQYQLVMELKHMPEMEELKIPAAPRLSSFVEQVKQFADTLFIMFSEFQLAEHAAPTRSAQLQLEPATIEISADGTSIELAVEIDDNNPRRRMLHCELLVQREEGGKLNYRLQSAENNQIFDVTSDEFGTATFYDLRPGIYQLDFVLNTQPISIYNLTLP